MRVLMVEDEDRLAETVRRGLAEQGFRVEVARTGEQALGVLAEREYDVIVLDIMLPGKSGYTVLGELRSRGVWAPVLMLSAKDGEFDQVDAFDLGADDYLTKPFSFLVLVARLRALIRRGVTERPVVLRAGSLTLDPVSHRVTRDGVDIRLTPREFSLLEFLMQHRGDAISKSEILDNVWDPSFDGDLNIVEVYVRYLRRKLDHPFGTDTIETIRGIGYRLDPDGGVMSRSGG
jgi:two-component system OmpR family response regulator